MNEFIVPTNFCRDFRDTVLWLSKSSLMEANLTFLIEGHQKRGFNRVYDIPQKDRHLCRDKGGLFKANEVAEIDEDVASDIKGCLSALKIRP